MSAYYWKSNKFKRLKAAWDKKLAKSGFKDIEVADSPKELLKTWDTYKFNKFTNPPKQPSKNSYDDNNDPRRFYERQDYYLKCAHLLTSNYKFKSAKHRRIWELHSEGLSFAEIARALKCQKSWAHYVVKKIRKDKLGI